MVEIDVYAQLDIRLKGGTLDGTPQNQLDRYWTDSNNEHLEEINVEQFMVEKCKIPFFYSIENDEHMNGQNGRKLDIDRQT